MAAGRQSPFLTRLRAGALLCDGAMGTQLYARGVPQDACFDAQNLASPQVVEAVHRDYILAGAQISVAEDDATRRGAAPEEAAAGLVALGADVIGANCSVGPQHMLAVMQRMAAAVPPETLLSAQPNAGWPSQVGGRIVYLSSPDYMARMARATLEAGVRLVGGCCGTTP